MRWDVPTACQYLNSDEQRLFLRANAVFGDTANSPSRDCENYKRRGVVPRYVKEFIEWRENAS